jgi:hypothetical protein
MDRIITKIATVQHTIKHRMAIAIIQHQETILITINVNENIMKEH